MNFENIRKKVTELANINFEQTNIDYMRNLFDYNVDAFKLLYFAMDIKREFNISIVKVFDKTNYTFLTINNLSKKIYDLLEE